MKHSKLCKLFSVLILMLLPMVSFAQENIDPDNDDSQFAYGENVGWLNAEPSGDGGPGVEVQYSKLTGYIWAENIGWISLSCKNTDYCETVEYGVENDGAGNLSGYAWAENAGWINFVSTGDGVTIDPATGEFSGYAWGENIGWISFRSTGVVAYGVKTYSFGGLIETIATLVEEGDISEKLQNGLEGKIRNVEKKSDKGKICAAINQLGAFKNLINAQRDKKVTEDAAEFLIEYANNLVEQLLNRLPEGESC